MLKVKIRFKGIIEYATILVMVILTGSARISTEDSGALFHSMAILLIVFLILSITNCLRTIPKRSEYILMGLALGFYYLLSILNYLSTGKGLFLRFVWFFLIYIWAVEHFNRAAEVFDKLYNLILLLAIISIIFFVGINFLKLNFPFSYIEHEGIDTYYKEYFYIFCTADRYHRTNVLGMSFYRLQSFFWEPGIFSIYLNIALTYLIFRKRKNNLHFFCLLFCTVFTLSTTGICIAAFLAAFYLVRNSNVLKSQRLLIAFPLLIVAGATGAFVWIEKILRTNVENGSYYIRIRDLLIGSRLILERPILGFGYKNYDRFLSLSEQGNSNGIIIWGFTMGFLGLFFILAPFVYVMFCTSKKKKFEELFFSFLFLIFNMTEPLLISPLMLFFVAYQYCKAFRLFKMRRARVHRIVDW